MPLPLRDFKGNPVVYLEGVTRVQMKALKVLLQPRQNGGFGLRAMEDEITSTLEIEGVDTSRESVRRILRGYAPKNEQESRIYGLKQGLEFISDPVHKITEENLSLLYQMTVGDFLDEEDRLLPGQRYRHDAVYVVGQNVEHTGLPHKKLPEYMARLAEFAQEDTPINDLVKGAVLHFYMAYLHPYFDGNGRMARLLHLWYLVQSGYPSALFVSFSSLIEGSRRGYYQAYTLCESNQTISGVLDVTPFLSYFIQNVYDKLEGYLPVQQSMERFQAALASGTVTEKEQKLWNYVLSAYGTEPFSTKQLEKDYGDAAYATIRSFVRKFQELGLLDSQTYRNRVKYWVK
jgi:Fic family protein